MWPLGKSSGLGVFGDGRCSSLYDSVSSVARSLGGVFNESEQEITSERRMQAARVKILLNLQLETTQEKISKRNLAGLKTNKLALSTFTISINSCQLLFEDEWMHR